MITRTFWAKTLTEAMRQAQAELGSDAVIMDTEEIRDRDTGRGKLFAVTASAGHARPVSNEEHAPRTYRRPTKSRVSKETMTQQPSTSSANLVEQGESKSKSAVDLNMAEALLKQMEQLQEELIELRTAQCQWQESSTQLDQLRTEMGILNDAVEGISNVGGGGDNPKQEVSVYSSMTEPSMAAVVASRVRGHGVGENAEIQLNNDEIAEAIPVTRPLWGDSSRKVAAFVGPSGVGKTTTLAKIAAEASYAYDQKVAIISVDGFRVGRSELIKGYCDMLEIPLEMARDRRELEAAIDKFSEYDLVLIDTWGHNPWNQESVEELENFFDGMSVERHLVLSATWRFADLEEVVQCYKDVHSLVITKIDEARGAAAVLAATWKSRYAVSHVCSGQEVLEGIEAADRNILAQQILADAA